MQILHLAVEHLVLACDGDCLLDEMNHYSGMSLPL